MHKFGYNPDADASTAAEDITPWGGSHFPDSVAAAADIDIVSDSVEDKGTATAGSGAQALLIQGLDENFLEIEETVILDGTDDVHPTLDYLRIYRAFVVKNAGAGAENTGVITIDIGGANIMAQILPGFGKTTQATYTIPANYTTAWLLDFDAGMVAKAAGKFAQGYLLIRPFGGVWQTEHVFGITSDKGYPHPYAMNLEIRPKSDIRLNIFDASADNLFLIGSLGIFLEG